MGQRRWGMEASPSPGTGAGAQSSLQSLHRPEVPAPPWHPRERVPAQALVRKRLCSCSMEALCQTPVGDRGENFN